MNNGVTFSGLGSGIDFSAIADAIIAQRTRPVTQLQNRRATMNDRASALKDLNARLITLTEAAKALADRSLGQGRAATSSAASVVAATATESAAFGSISLEVTRLASALSQGSRTYASAASPVLANGAAEAVFELRKGGAGAGVEIRIDESNNTLAGLRDQINAAGAGVSAQIVDVTGAGTEFKLVLTSTDTGASVRVELVETTSTGTGADLDLRTLNSIGDPPDHTLLDAAINVNGLAVTRSSNTVSDLVSGVTFNLKGAGAATVNVAADTSALADKLSAFVNAYNRVQDFVAAQYAPNSNGNPGGVLVGDATLVNVQRQLRDALAATSASNGGSFSSLAEIGVGRDSAGKLTLDRTVLDEKLKSSLADVRALLSGKTENETGLANLIHETSDGLSDKISGVVQMAIDGYAASVKSLDKSIAAQQERIEALRLSLTRQFAAADAAIGQLNGQNTALTNFLKSLEPRR